MAKVLYISRLIAEIVFARTDLHAGAEAIRQCFRVTYAWSGFRIICLGQKSATQSESSLIYRMRRRAITRPTFFRVLLCDSRETHFKRKECWSRMVFLLRK